VRGNKRGAGLLVAVLLAVVLAPGSPGWAAAQATLASPPALVVRFLDVGQGDSAWLTLPDGRTALIDCGPTSHGRRLVAELQAHGVEHIDVLAPSHAHADHMGGCIEIVRQLTVGELLWTGQTATSLTWRTFWAEVLRRELPITRVSVGQVFDWGNGATATVLNPIDHSDGSPIDEYDDSHALLIEYFGTRLLFVGDLQTRGEQRLLASGLPLQAHVLKVAEHGSASASSAAFLAAVRPNLAVLSHAAVNAFDLPDPVVLARLEAVGAQVVRTAEVGTVTVTVGGYAVQTER
jgi:competence protein ComEC